MIRTLSGAYDKDAKLPDYLEATIYNKEEAVIMIGNFADIENYEQKSKINQVTKWYKPWFYKHVETFLEKRRPLCSPQRLPPPQPRWWPHWPRPQPPLFSQEQPRPPQPQSWSPRRRPRC